MLSQWTFPFIVVRRQTAIPHSYINHRSGEHCSRCLTECYLYSVRLFIATVYFPFVLQPSICAHINNPSECKTRYYHNYYVSNASSADSERVFYSTEDPNYVEITDHIYVDKDFCTWVRLEITINQYVKANGLRIKT